MKIVIATDSYKGSLTAVEVCHTIAKVLQAQLPKAEMIQVPMADGGEGTLAALIQATGGIRVPLTVSGPRFEPVSSAYGVLGDGKTVVIESAAVVGYGMVPDGVRDPSQTTTLGLGELILHALNAGYRQFMIGLGGSLTNDGGIGCLQALGGAFFDAAGQTVSPVGASLAEVQRVELRGLDTRLKESQFIIASDVTNPLCGPEGASRIFAPQKGATPQMAAALDAGMAHYAALIEARVGASLQTREGAGAAGGLGFALLTIGANIQSGAGLVAEKIGLETILRDADYVITGEGRTDEQTLYGKAPWVVAQLAKRMGVQPILLSGSLQGDLSRLKVYFPRMHETMVATMTVDEAMAQAETLLEQAAKRLAESLKPLT